MEIVILCNYNPHGYANSGRKGEFIMYHSKYTEKCPRCLKKIKPNDFSEQFPNRVSKVITFKCPFCDERVTFSPENAEHDFLDAALDYNDHFYNG